MKIFNKTTPTIILVCLSLSWQTNSPSSRTDNDAMEVDSFQNQTVTESDEMNCNIDLDSNYFECKKRKKIRRLCNQK